MAEPHSAPDARAALERAAAAADPDDLPCLPAATRVAGRFPWKEVLRFVAARDLARGLAQTHRAAWLVCRHEQTFRRILNARHRGGCERAKDEACAWGGGGRGRVVLGLALIHLCRCRQSCLCQSRWCPCH